MTLEKIIEQIVVNYNLMCGTGKQQMLIKEIARAATEAAASSYDEGYKDAITVAAKVGTR